MFAQVFMFFLTYEPSNQLLAVFILKMVGGHFVLGFDLGGVWLYLTTKDGDGD